MKQLNETDRVEPVWMTTKEAAEHLRTTPKQIRNWVYQGRIKCYRILGHNFRFRRGDLDAIVQPPDVWR